MKGNPVCLALQQNDSMKYFCAWIPYFMSVFTGVFKEQYGTCVWKSKLINQHKENSKTEQSGPHGCDL